MRGLWSRAGALPPGSRKLISREREYLREGLQRLGFYVFPSEANFLLFKRTDRGDGGELYESLLSRGILIRRCGDYQGLSGDHYRICVKKKGRKTGLFWRIWEKYIRRGNKRIKKIV